MQRKSLWRLAAAAAVLAGMYAMAQAPQRPPGPVVPPSDLKPGSGISGPGATPNESRARWVAMNRSATGSVVKLGLIPEVKPLMDIQMRDTVIRVGGDGMYYLTGSTGEDIWDHNDGVELWRSADLKKWDYLGLVWSFEKDGTWERAWRWYRKPTRALWAPEFHYIKRLKNYFITLSMPPGDRGILKSTTGKPEGPYVNALANDAKLEGDIDASLFEDDDGTVYLVYGGGLIARMKDDMSGLAEDPKKPALLDPDTNPAHHADTCASRRGQVIFAIAPEQTSAFVTVLLDGRGLGQARQRERLSRAWIARRRSGPDRRLRHQGEGRAGRGKVGLTRATSPNRPPQVPSGDHRRYLGSVKLILNDSR
jgi:hypothetical protein